MSRIPKMSVYYDSQQKSQTFLKLSHFKMKNYFNDQLGLYLAYKSVQLSNHRCSFVYEELHRMRFGSGGRL